MRKPVKARDRRQESTFSNIAKNAHLMARFASHMGRILDVNSNVVELKLVGLRIGAAGWNDLSRALKACNSVRTLTFNFCSLRDDGVVALVQGVNMNIRRLDLSNNEITHVGAREIAKLVSRHGEYRDQAIWAAGLRGAKAEKGSADGLVELSLVNNRLGDKGAINLCTILYHDIWIRAIDLRRNKITSSGLAEIQTIVSQNETLVYLDIRLNGDDSGIETMKQLICILQNNLVRLKKKQPDNRYESAVVKLEGELYPIPEGIDIQYEFKDRVVHKSILDIDTMQSEIPMPKKATPKQS